jgi:cytochrome oxidase assembly protein ShyY1
VSLGPLAAVLVGWVLMALAMLALWQVQRQPPRPEHRQEHHQHAPAAAARQDADVEERQ